MIGIYAITQNSSGVSYVGSSVNVALRWKRHRTDLNCGRHHSVGLQRAWSKHGAKAFNFKVLEECGRDVLRAREDNWIKSFVHTFNSMRPSDRVGVMEHGPATKVKMSAAQKARGHKLSSEHIELMHRCRREIGWSFSPQTRARMSEAARHKAPPGMATRDLLRQANLRRMYRRIRRVTDGETFISLAAAGRMHGISNSAIYNAIKRGSQAGGHCWEYI